MNTITLKFIAQENFEVIRVFSFTESYMQNVGTIVYRRPLSDIYNKDNPDIFDKTFMEWLNELGLKDVKCICSSNVLFENQLNNYNKIYNGGRPISKLSITCCGNYTLEEIESKESVEARILELPIYWNVIDKKLLSDIGGIVYFDRTKENFFFEAISSIKSL